ncbi:MAG: hypothetical protein R3B09_15885 [Nannocystaceae bacterium]
MSSTSASATSTTTTETSTSTSSTATTGCAFLCLPDHGAVDQGCSSWEQDCPEGQKCNAWANDGGGAWNANKCVPVVPDPDAVGEPCSVEGSGVSGLDSCDKGAMCWSVDPETNVGVCVGLCQGDETKCTSDPSTCCPPGSACVVGQMAVLILCLQSCDPLLQDCEGNGEVCYPEGVDFKCAPDVSGDMGAGGDPCDVLNECDPGTFCGNPAFFPGCDPNAAGCCIPFCSLMSPGCVMGTVCQPWYDPMDVPPGYEDLGACVIP